MDTVKTDYSIETAALIYQMWHEKVPGELVETPVFDPPKHAYAVGAMEYIQYKSDKWEDDGNFFNYIHKHDSGPTLYVTTGECLGAPVVAYDRIKVTDIAPQFKGAYGKRVKQSGFPLLAACLSLTYHDGVKRRKIGFQSYKPILTCTEDRRTLIIFADELLFIHGGDMIVLPDGIAY